MLNLSSASSDLRQKSHKVALQLKKAKSLPVRGVVAGPTGDVVQWYSDYKA